MSENHQKLQSINERVNLAQAKIDKLKGSNKVDTHYDVVNLKYKEWYSE